MLWLSSKTLTVTKVLLIIFKTLETVNWVGSEKGGSIKIFTVWESLFLLLNAIGV